MMVKMIKYKKKLPPNLGNKKTPYWAIEGFLNQLFDKEFIE